MSVNLFLIYFATALAAYLLGSVPTGYLVARAKGIDIRSVGSGNIGATNAMRVLGKPAGIFVLLVDVLKGYAACALLAPFVFHLLGDKVYELAKFGLPPVCVIENRNNIVAGIGVVLGHNYTCWLKFKGGKGIATTAGVFLALAPWALLMALVVFILALVFTKYVSVASIAAAIALPTAVWIMTPQNILLGTIATALGVMAIYKHQGNIQRLRAGTENRIGKKSSTSEKAK